MEYNAVCAVKYRHADNSSAREGHFVEVRVQGEVIAERFYALRESELCPWKQFIICGDGVDWLNGIGLVWLMTTCLQRIESWSEQ